MSENPPLDSSRAAQAALAGIALLSATTGVALYVAVTTRSFVAGAACLHLAIGTLVWGLVQVATRQRLRAEAERLEEQRLETLAAEGRQALYAAYSSQGDASEASGLGVNVLALLTSLASIGGAAYLASVYPLTEVHPALGPAAALGASAFGLLLLGRYASALGSSLLEAGARRALSGAGVALVAALVLALLHKGALQADYAGYGLAGLELLLGLEGVSLLVLEVYRPRRASEEPRLPFESRLLGLLLAPTRAASSIAKVVNYQFGFAISQTWAYRFLAQWGAPTLLFSLTTFWLMSCLVVVEPHQVVLVRRLGSLQPDPLGPGLHVEFPWPLSELTRVEARRLHEVSTGHHMGGGHEGALLWTSHKMELEHHVEKDDHHGDDHHGDEDDEHGGHGDHEDPLVLIPRASSQAGQTPVNLISAATVIHYHIRDAPRYAQRSRRPRQALKALAERGLTFLFGQEDLDQLLQKRFEHQEVLRQRIQAGADRLQLGVTIDSALLTDLHPPLEVGKAFEAVSAAQEQARAEVLRARRLKILLKEQTSAEVERIAAEGALEARRRVMLAQADAERFEALRALHRASPEVFRSAWILDVLVKGMPGKRKLVTGEEGVLLELDLQEKVSAVELGLGQELQDEQTRQER